MLQTAIQARHVQAPVASWSKIAPPKSAPTSRAGETRVSLRNGERLFEEGDASDYFYKLQEGSMRLVKILADGHRQICDFHLAGDLVGFTTGGEHDFSAEAIADCVLVRYRRRDVDVLIEADPAFARELQEMTAKGLNSAYAHLVRLCHRSAHDRVARFLISMAERTQSQNGWIELPMSRCDIADYLGMAHETVSRAFTQLKKAGVIVEPTLNRIRLIDQDALEDQLAAA